MPLFSVALLFLVLLPTLLRAEPDAVSARAAGWTREETRLALLGVAGTLLLASQDQALRELALHNDGRFADQVASSADLLGHPLTLLGGSALLWAVGEHTGHSRLAVTGRLAGTAILGATVTTALFKVVAGRERPDGESDHFHPFRLDDDFHSLPSAHSAAAFALAAVLARRSDQPWVDWSAYALASLVGLSRIAADEHWASDVVAGAVVGELWGRWIVRNNDNHQQFFVAPLSGGGSIGVVVRW